MYGLPFYSQQLISEGSQRFETARERKSRAERGRRPAWHVHAVGDVADRGPGRERPQMIDLGARQCVQARRTAEVLPLDQRRVHLLLPRLVPQRPGLGHAMGRDHIGDAGLAGHPGAATRLDLPEPVQMYDLGQRKETGLGPINDYEVSADQKKMIVSKDAAYAIIDLPKAPVNITEPLNLSAMEVKLDRHMEWQQIFNESWRQMRDFFYAPNMHGVDWPAVRRKYEPLVPL